MSSISLIDEKIQIRTFRGTWQSSDGDKIILTPSGNNLLIGTYQKKINDEIGVENFEIVGYYRDNILSFVVDMTDYNICISWIGKLIENDFNAEAIEAQWSIVNDDKLNIFNKNIFGENHLSGIKLFNKSRF